MTTKIPASVKYLSRAELYKEEKPYKITFDIANLDESVKKTNHVFQTEQVQMIDAQPIRSRFSLDTNGFEFRRHPTALQDTDFDDEHTVRLEYFKEVESLLQTVFPGNSHIQVLGYQRRKRGQNFPGSASYNIPTLNPVLYVHADFTPQGASTRLANLFEKDPSLKSRDYQLVNVWRVTKGPNIDWPLALCDHSTVNIDTDLEFSDVVHRDHVGENCMFYFNPSHRWYFLDEQQIGDVLVFRHTHSKGVQVPFAGHVAFDRGAHVEQGRTVLPRESIEVKAVVFE